MLVACACSHWSVHISVTMVTGSLPLVTHMEHVGAPQSLLTTLEAMDLSYLFAHSTHGLPTLWYLWKEANTDQELARLCCALP